MCYINSTLDLAMVSIVGDSQESLQLELYVDADLAGDPNSKFSTSGVWFGVGGPHTRASLCCLSKRQTSRAFSTAEAEIVAYALGLRTEGLPGLDLWETILQRRVRLLVWEDNKSTKQLRDSGRSHALRHLGRTHGVSLAWLHEQTAVDGIDVDRVDSSFRLADIFTKAFDSTADWKEKLKLISHVAFERNQAGRLRPLSTYPTITLISSQDKKLVAKAVKAALDSSTSQKPVSYTHLTLPTKRIV